MVRSSWWCLWFFLCGCLAPKKPQATVILENMQAANASKNQLLAWNQTIDSRQFGLVPNSSIDGKTLAQVISSQSPGREDNLLCSSCHNSSDSQGGYGGQSAKNTASSKLLPTDKVNNRSWIEKGGWAERFVKNGSKPSNLKLFMQAWIDNGYK